MPVINKSPFLWGGATADFQFDGGYPEDGRGLSTHDFETDDSLEHPRCVTWKLPDGTVGESRSSFFCPENLPDGAVPYLAEGRYYPSHRAVDFYHHWKEDLTLLAGMGCNGTSDLIQTSHFPKEKKGVK